MESIAADAIKNQSTKHIWDKTAIKFSNINRGKLSNTPFQIKNLILHALSLHKFFLHVLTKKNATAIIGINYHLRKERARHVL